MRAESRAVRCEMKDPMLEPHPPIVALVSAATVEAGVVVCCCPEALLFFDNERGLKPFPDWEVVENVEERVVLVSTLLRTFERSASERDISTGVPETVPVSVEDKEVCER